MRRSVAVGLAIAGVVAVIGPTGTSVAVAAGSASTSSSLSAGQDEVCADRCEAGRDYCNAKCQEPPKDTKKPAESTKECVKTCNVDPKHEGIDSWTPKETACIKACIHKTKPCMQACRTKHRACLATCQH